MSTTITFTETQLESLNNIIKYMTYTYNEMKDYYERDESERNSHIFNDVRIAAKAIGSKIDENDYKEEEGNVDCFGCGDEMDIGSIMEYRLPCGSFCKACMDKHAHCPKCFPEDCPICAEAGYPQCIKSGSRS
jgi:hypothetical protein